MKNLAVSEWPKAARRDSNPSLRRRDAKIAFAVSGLLPRYAASSRGRDNRRSASAAASGYAARNAGVGASGRWHCT